MSFNLLHTMCCFQGTNLTNNVLLVISCKNLFLHQIANKSFFIIRRPPTLPYRHQYSTIGRLCLTIVFGMGTGVSHKRIDTKNFLVTLMTEQ